MPFIYITINLLIAALFLGIGVAALLNDRKSRINRLFFQVVVFLTAWIITNYLSNVEDLSYQAALWANHLVLFSSGFVVMTITRFTATICRQQFLIRHDKFLTISGALVYAAALTPLVVTGIIWQENVYAIEFGPLAILYFATIIVHALLATYALLWGMRGSKGEEKRRRKALFWSLVSWFAIALLTNGVIPYLTGWFALTNLGPVSSIIFVAGIYYTVIRHKLFDLRAAIARFMAYALLVATLSGLYTVTVFGLANRLLGTESVFAQQVVPIISAIFLVFTAPYFKRLFDKITNRLFYQDAYDPQTLLDDLNKVLIGNIELSILLRHASNVIQQHLKSEMCLVAVRQVSSAPVRIIGTMDPHLDEEDIKILRHDLAKQETKVTSAEDVSVHNTRLNRLLKAKNIAIVVRLQTSHDQDGDALAYLILGPKRSGNIYNRQDFRIIEIIADEMVIAIQNALRFEEIQGFAVTLQERVNEATTKLKRTNAKLKEMDETKDEFISMASHQLRTPLTSVKGYLSMVLEGDAGKVSPAQQKLLDQAFISSQRMVYLIADLLNVSRLKTGKFVITSAPTNMADMVEGELNQLTEVAKGKNIKVTYKKPNDFTTLMLDETKVRQVVMNFVDNAIYYTPSGGKVNVEVKEDRNNVYFTVKDNGMGIPREDQKHLFTKFYRASNARQVRPDGTGLGLFMAKKVVAAQGGTILFESTEGKGSTFGFSFNKSKLKIPESTKTGA